MRCAARQSACPQLRLAASHPRTVTARCGPLLTIILWWSRILSRTVLTRHARLIFPLIPQPHYYSPSFISQRAGTTSSDPCCQPFFALTSVRAKVIGREMLNVRTDYSRTELRAAMRGPGGQAGNNFVCHPVVITYTG